MNGVATHEGRPSRRLLRFRGPLVGAALALLAAPALLHFAGTEGIASIGDDSVSYLALARYLAGSAGPFLLPWVGLCSHFPPVFPLALAVSGGATDLAIAHRVVAAFAVAALFVLQRHAALRLRSEAAGAIVVLAFLLTPDAWVSIKGILSEPAYLFVSLLALYFHARWLEAGSGRAGRWLGFGLLLAAAVLTRAAGVALLAAFLAWAAWRRAHRAQPSGAHLLVALLPSLALEALWLVLRPTAGDAGYAGLGAAVVHAWLHDPALMLEVGARSFFEGWIASFAGDAAIPLPAIGAFVLLGIAALAGAVRAARDARLDGWYVIAYLPLVFGWVFGEEAVRRLLYPVLPLMLLHAGEAVFALARPAGRRGTWIAWGALAVPAVLCAPALQMVQERADDRTPVLPPSPRTFSGITDYYTTVNGARAHALAGKQLAVLAGLESLGRVTRPGSKVMWMRPEYVAALGGREGVPYDYDWTPGRLAREILDSGTTHVIASHIFKTDLRGGNGDPLRTLRSIGAYARPVFAVRNPSTGGEEFVLYQVDAAALAASLRAAAPAPRSR